MRMEGCRPPPHPTPPLILRGSRPPQPGGLGSGSPPEEGGGLRGRQTPSLYAQEQDSKSVLTPAPGGSIFKART